MKMKTIAILLPLGLLAAACNFKSPVPANTSSGTNNNEPQMHGGAQVENANLPKGAGSYKDYSAATVSSEQQAGKTVVLFFHAPWCPDCRAADAVFRANPSSIPAGVTLLKTDYDSNTELKKKYGVTYQHTFVQIDSQGNMVTKWVSGDTDMLKRNIKL